MQMPAMISRTSLPIVLLALAGCASAPVPLRTLQSPPIGELSASLGTVGVVSVTPNGSPEFNPSKRSAQTGGGFLSGAGKGAGDWASGFLEAGGSAGGSGAAGAALFVVFLVGLPVAAIVGGVDANGGNQDPKVTLRDLSKTDREKWETMIRKVLPTYAPKKKLRQPVVAQASNTKSQKFIESGDAKTLKTELASLRQRGVTTALEVTVDPITFTVAGAGKEPKIAFSVSGRTRLVRVSDNQVLWSSDDLKAYSADAGTLSQWADNEGMLLRSELDDAVDRLAQVLVFTVLGEPSPPSEQDN